ncbi:MAG: DNA polymerase III subunit epsilon, partial [Brevundimonas sp.]|nr:DNA polymerase III subunit epsilon [Brevundimonas sp.]
ARTLTTAAAAAASGGYGPRPRPLAARVTEAEEAAHLAVLRATLKDHAVWAAYGLDVEVA